MLVSAALFIEWLNAMADTSITVERILNTWLDSAKSRSTDPEDKYYDGILVWDNKPKSTYSFIDPYTQSLTVSDNPVKKMSKQMYQHLMEVSPITLLDHTRLGRLEWDNYEFEYADLRPTKHNPLVKPKPKYKVLDFDDNILGEAHTINEALNIFYTRYAVFDKKAALHFIEEI